VEKAISDFFDMLSAKKEKQLSGNKTSKQQRWRCEIGNLCHSKIEATIVFKGGDKSVSAAIVDITTPYPTFLLFQNVSVSKPIKFTWDNDKEVWKH
jgi:hypothetical protein